MPGAALGGVQAEGAVPMGATSLTWGGFLLRAGTRGLLWTAPVTSQGTSLQPAPPLKSDGHIKAKVKVQGNLYLSRHGKSSSFTLRGFKAFLFAR